MKRTAIFILLGLVMLVTGCTSVPSVWELKYGPDKPQFSYVKQSSGQNTGDLYIWNPNTTAAYTSASGKTCIQTADVYRVQSSVAAAKIAAEGKAGVSGELSGNSGVSQAALLLGSQDAKGTFLSVALFNICMLSINGVISSTEANGLVLEAIKSAANMTGATFAPNPTVTSDRK